MRSVIGERRAPHRGSPAERAQCPCRRRTAGAATGQEEVAWRAECSEVEDEGKGVAGLEDAVTHVSDGADVSDFCWEGETTEGREGRCSSVSV